jgi:uncharacterized protein
MSAHGRVIWNELNTHDVESAKRFFTDTLGWSYDAMPMPEGGTYWVIRNGEERAGGIFPLDGPQFAGVPDHWMTYIGVDDCDGRVAQAATSGGSVLREPWTIDGIGRVAILKAPGGAVMAWMTPAMPG